jgi:DNA-binding MurR/RpiR family transcriptional regulator
MGFRGYPSFQKEVRRIVRAELKGTERFRIVNSNHGKDFNLLLDVMNKEIENISHVQEMFHEKEFKKAIHAIKSAREIVVIGTRSTASLAFHFWFGLTKLGIKATRITSLTTEGYDLINRLDPQCLVIVIGFPRYLREWVEVVGFSKERGLRTLTLTDSRFSPLTGDINLYCSAESSSFIAFHCAPLILINTIVTGLSLEDRKKTLSELDRFERMAEARNYFIKV